MLLMIISSVLVGSFTYANGPSAAKTDNVTLILGNVIGLDLTSNGGNMLLFATQNDYQNGVSSDNATTLKVSSNKNWKVSVCAASDYFSSTNSSDLIPVSILKLKVANSK